MIKLDGIEFDYISNWTQLYYDLNSYVWNKPANYIIEFIYTIWNIYKNELHSLSWLFFHLLIKCGVARVQVTGRKKGLYPPWGGVVNPDSAERDDDRASVAR